MKYKDVIYPSITDRIDKIRNEIDTALENNGDNELLEECSDALSDATDEITEVYSGNIGAPCLGRLYSDINSKPCFSAVSVSGWNELLLLFQIAIIIECDGTLDLEDDISLNEAEFCLTEYTGTALPFTALGYYNQTDINKSLAYIKIQQESLTSDITDNDGGFTNGLLCLLLHFLSELQESLELNRAYILHDKNIPNTSSAESSIKMHAALRGKVIHIERPSYNMNAPDSMLNRIAPADPYNQFEETLIIISELNKSDDILGTFISMYHVIESFMFKVPIVNLAANNGGNIFSLRDFRRLSEAVKDNEMSSLVKLFNDDDRGKFWVRDINGTKLNDIVSNEISTLQATSDWSDQDCEDFLSHIEVKGIKNYSDLRNDLNADRYAKIIYKIRCAIIHNKETELHLSYFNINKTIERILNDVLIKPLLLLISDLLTDKSSKVWYTGPELKLYQV